MRTLFAPTKVEKLGEPIQGTVEQTIAPNQPGRVKCRATYWPARFYHPDCQTTVISNQRVNIVAIQGITLLVVPVDTTEE
ncbi:hypothetical protein H6F61_21100 [Cyanobacteria bacterium FACHB-472]|nr:hypothetical protein [Cyanobacteria bacterium FACHB-472]